MNITQIINRLKTFFGLKTNKQLADKLGILTTTLSNWKKDNIFNFVELYPIIKEIDFEWLVKGTKSFQNFEEIKTISSSNFYALCNEGNNPPIVLIPEKAQAGYLGAFGQYENEDLLIMPHTIYKNGHKFRYFGISGNSMESTLFGGDCVFCEKKEIQEIKQGKIYVFYTKNGFLCKRLNEISNTKEKKITLHSDNSKYTPQILDKSDILEIWEVKEINRKIE